MSNLSNYAENKLIDAVFRAQALGAPATMYHALLTSTHGPRANSTAYALNNTISVVANDGKVHLYKCTTAGTTAAKVKTVNAIGYIVNGRTYAKAATDDLFTLSGTTMAAGEVCAFWLYLNAAGTASIEQSAIKKASTTTSTTERYVAGAFDWPDPVDKCCIGAVVITATGAFVPGTTTTAVMGAFVNAGPDYGAPITY